MLPTQILERLWRGGLSVTLPTTTLLNPPEPAAMPRPLPQKPSATAIENRTDELSDSEVAALQVIDPAFNAVLAIDAFMPKHRLDPLKAMQIIRANMSRAKKGDLSALEGMLVAQASALDCIFGALASRAGDASTPEFADKWLNLAFKAQAQSRASIQGVIDLKHPRQQTFVRQANIAHGHQQVNNVDGFANVEESRARSAGMQPVSNELLVENADGGKTLDFGTTAASVSCDRTLEAVGESQRPPNRRR